MPRRSTFVLLSFALAASGFTYLLARAGSPRHEDQQASPSSGVETGQTVDQNSMQQMMRTMMSGIVPPGIKPGDLPDTGSEGAKLVVKYCAQCHDLPSPLMHAAHEWPGIAQRMFNRMAMCSRMSGKGMNEKMGGMEMKGMMVGMSGNGMMGMMNVQSPTDEQQKVIVEYLEKHSLKSIQPGALPSPRTEGGVVFAATCAQCHALPDPKQHTAEQWPQAVARMRKNMAAMGKSIPDTATLRLITEFLEDAARAKP